MIDENIKRCRKARGMSQEEMAVRLNVVRQTVSKWENGLSVPDADVLVRMADLLGVSVGTLLGINEPDLAPNLSEELQRLNEQLAQRNRRERLVRRAGEKRGLIVALSVAALMVALMVGDGMVSVALAGACMLAAVVVLYRNLALLTSVTTDDLKTGVLRVVILVDGAVLAVGIVLAVLIASGILVASEGSEKMLAMAVVSCVMVFAGVVSPKLPYSNHTGLRLPWTVRDKDTWDVAHRIVGYVSLPIALLYIACALTLPDFEAVTLGAMVAWIGIPGVLSYLFFRKKMRGR